MRNTATLACSCSIHENISLQINFIAGLFQLYKIKQNVYFIAAFILFYCIETTTLDL